MGAETDREQLEVDDRDPLHHRSGAEVDWTTGNVNEALPGVSTPLTWSWFGDACERSFWGGYADLGIVPRSWVKVSDDVDERIWTTFFGRSAANVDTFARIISFVPGTSVAAWQQQILGVAREDTPVDSLRRVPAIALRAPAAVVRLPQRITAARQRVATTWRAGLARLDASVDTADSSRSNEAGPRLAIAREVLLGAHDQFETIMRHHAVATMVAQGLFEQIRQIAEGADMQGLEARLVTGLGSIEETTLMHDLWTVSRGDTPMTEFLAAHGYHGPSEGELSSHSWREEPGPAEAVARTYAAMSEERSPRSTAERQVEARVAATGELLARLPRSRRAKANLLLRWTARFLPLREVGKSGFVQAIDLGRAAARSIGHDLHRAGTIADPDDVFYLTIEELTGAAPPPGDAIALRKARRAQYLRYTLPDTWTGHPAPIPIVSLDQEDLGVTGVEGLGVSPGMAEGLVRVVHSPEESELQDGEILVCNTTHPGWTSLFPIAAALVVDVGGEMSHGAIVAREVGVPCVMGTKAGTTRLRTGDYVRVDGSTGVVEVLRRAADVS